MTVDDALNMMSAIEGQADGSKARAVIVAALQEKLVTEPESFFEFYFEMLNTSVPNQYRELAERLLKTGEVTTATTLVELPTILARK